MEPTAIIKITKIDNGLLIFEWQGPQDGIIGISKELWEMGDPKYSTFPNNPQVGTQAKLGPFALTVVAIDNDRNIIFCVQG
jgi:hypothetical protein